MGRMVPVRPRSFFSIIFKYYFVIIRFTDVRVIFVILPWRMFHPQAVRGSGSERAEFEITKFYTALLSNAYIQNHYTKVPVRSTLWTLAR